MWKAPRGSYVLDREARKAEAVRIERREKAKARHRDGRCRWPERHECLCGLESAHVVDASLGGPMRSDNLVTLCAWLHRRGPESIHGKQLRVDAETPRGADGPLSFWRRDIDGVFYLVRRESAPFRYERD